ncbi:MAG TPA: hypothetical protein VF271_08000 [Rhodanobacteraceae bacterium]
MNRFARLKLAVMALLMLGLVLGLAACSSNVKSVSVAQAKAAGDFGLVVKAWKGGQFSLDGAVLTSLDLSSHFAYLRDQHELPKTVLLERSDKYKVRRDHLRYMASMALTYGFAVYYSHKGELRRILPTAANKTKLSDKAPVKTSTPEVDEHSAAHNGTMPGVDQY